MRKSIATFAGFVSSARSASIATLSFPRSTCELFSPSFATGGSLVAEIAALSLGGRGPSSCSSSEGVAPT